MLGCGQPGGVEGAFDRRADRRAAFLHHPVEAGDIGEPDAAARGQRVAAVGEPRDLFGLRRQQLVGAAVMPGQQAAEDEVEPPLVQSADQLGRRADLDAQLDPRRGAADFEDRRDEAAHRRAGDRAKAW